MVLLVRDFKRISSWGPMGAEIQPTLCLSSCELRRMTTSAQRKWHIFLINMKTYVFLGYIPQGCIYPEGLPFSALYKYCFYNIEIFVREFILTFTFLQISFLDRNSPNVLLTSLPTFCFVSNKYTYITKE